MSEKWLLIYPFSGRVETYSTEANARDAAENMTRNASGNPGPVVVSLGQALAAPDLLEAVRAQREWVELFASDDHIEPIARLYFEETGKVHPAKQSPVDVTYGDYGRWITEKFQAQLAQLNAVLAKAEGVSR